MMTLHVAPPNVQPFTRAIGDEVPLIIGRSSQADLTIADRSMSRQHVRLSCTDGQWYVEDMGSRNGTVMDGRPVKGPVAIRSGSVLQVGGTSITIGVAGEDASTSSFGGQTIFRSAAEMLGEASSSAGLRGDDRRRRESVESLRVLNDVHRALASSITVEELLELILDRAFEHLRPEEGAIFLKGADGEVSCVSSRSLKGGGGGLSLRSSHLIDEVVGCSQAALVVDAQLDGRFNQAMSLLDAGVRSLVAAPMLDAEGATGMIVLGSTLNVREFSESDMELLVSLASVAAMRIRNVRLAEEATERRLLQKELNLARRIQVALLQSTLPDLPSYELRAGNIPSRGVSGDFYKLALRNEGRECVVMLADVSGKGMAASLLTASLEALSAPLIESGAEPVDICVQVSRLLFERTPPEKYATCFLAVLEPESGNFTYVNAGHNPGLLLRGDGASEWLTSSGVPIGILPHGSFEQRTVNLGPGDTVLLYTDGITEAENPEEEEYGEDRLRAVATAHCCEPLAALTGAIETDVDSHVRGVPFADDRTLVIVRRCTA